MNREVITNKQGVILVILFIMGSSLVIGTGSEAGKDTWISILLSMLFAFPMLMIYARILSLFPKKDLFDILEYVFGKFIGKIMILIYIWFVFHLAALVIRNFGTFIKTVSLEETPEIIPMMCITFLCALGIKKGIEVISRWGELAVIILISLLIMALLLLIPNMDSNNIQPILAKGFKPVLKGAFSVFAFPFAETVSFCLIFSALKNSRSIYISYTWGLIVGGSVLFLTTLVDILVLGEEEFASTFFPIYTTVSRTNVGDFIQRAEIIVSIAFLGAGFIKVCVCLLGTCKGISKLFGFKDYRFIITPVSLLTLNFSYLVYESLIEMTQWAFITWNYYAFLFQVILPIIIWIGSEIKKKT